jgi:hypothetical protein
MWSRDLFRAILRKSQRAKVSTGWASADGRPRNVMNWADAKVVILTDRGMMPCSCTIVSRSPFDYVITAQVQAYRLEGAQVTGSILAIDEIPIRLFEATEEIPVKQDDEFYTIVWTMSLDRPDLNRVKQLIDFDNAVRGRHG